MPQNDDGRTNGGSGPGPKGLGEEVWVWRFAAAAPGPVWDCCFEMLAEKERARAMGMRVGMARDEFVTGRAVLRAVLGSVLGRDGGAVEIEAGRHGKPEVAGGEVWFNVAHSRGTILLAVCLAGEVGVDVEWIDGTIDAAEIAQAHFTEAEQSLVYAPGTGPRAFYEIWTRKEAAVKAAGLGLVEAEKTGGLRTIEVLRGDCVEVGGSSVSLQMVDAGPEWACAVGCIDMRRAVELTRLDEPAIVALLERSRVGSTLIPHEGLDVVKSRQPAF